MLGRIVWCQKYWEQRWEGWEGKVPFVFPHQGFGRKFFLSKSISQLPCVWKYFAWTILWFGFGVYGVWWHFWCLQEWSCDIFTILKPKHSYLIVGGEHLDNRRHPAWTHQLHPQMEKRRSHSHSRQKTRRKKAEYQLAWSHSALQTAWHHQQTRSRSRASAPHESMYKNEVWILLTQKKHWKSGAENDSE